MALGTHLTTRWRIFDSHGLARSDIEACIEVKPSAKYQAYLSEQAD